VRTFVGAGAEEDLATANALQDGLKIEQADTGTFDIRRWDTESLETIRDALKVLFETTTTPVSDMFGVWHGPPPEYAKPKLYQWRPSARHVLGQELHTTQTPHSKL